VSDEVADVLDVLNAWAEADLDRVRATHAELQAQVLPRPPLVLPQPTPHGGSRQRAGRRRGTPR